MIGLPNSGLAHGTLTMCASVTLHCQSYLAAHNSLLRSLVPGVLLPLLFTRVGANIRSAIHQPAPSRAVETVHSDAFDETLDAASAWELRRTNQRLASELRTLREAYEQLAAQAADRAAATERLSFLAYHDVLTGLPNRALLLDRLNAALRDARRDGTGVLVFYLDLNYFKQVNDTLGHAAGDRVLRVVAARIRATIGATDCASRVGGDEFVIVCATDDRCSNEAQLEAQIGAAIAAPIDIDGIPIAVGASFGTSRFPSDGCDPVALIDRADKAMYRARSVSRR